MHFEPERIYHVYNQGNNKEPIFFCDENYIYFIEKMRNHLCPYVHLLAYCLMPNHFHWLIKVKQSACVPCQGRKPRRVYPPDLPIERDYQYQLNHQIGILLRSYTRGINQQQGRTGSLFRKGTKAKHFLSEKTISLGSDLLESELELLELQYLSTCFNYIHHNPVKAGLSIAPEDWPFSSYQEYIGQNPNPLCNTRLGKALIQRATPTITR